MITNISFDLWLTLIRSHPQFKWKRAEMLARSYNPKGYSVEQIDLLIRRMDKVFDRYNESFGKKIPASIMYQKTLSELCKNKKNIDIEEAKEVEAKANKLFIEHNPQLLNKNISFILKALKEEGKILNLASNTGFIEGTTLRIVLDKLDILKYFSFTIFSDEINTSKPSTDFFDQVQKQANVPKKNILHVGDNVKTDYQGALDFGFSALLVKQNYTLDDIRPKLQRQNNSLLWVSDQF